MGFIIFTDLDGTLLDHEDYGYAAAIPALDRLKQTGTPLILASSKTACEISPLRNELGFAHFPAIVENGAGLLAADETPMDHIASDSEYTGIRACLEELPKALRRHYTGFGDVSVGQVAKMTGLTSEQARLAKLRQFSEPGIWNGSPGEQEDFITTLGELGVRARQGGRFLTLSFGRTKADQMQHIIAELCSAGAKCTVVALGDAPNDMEMLISADIGIVIENPYGMPLGHQLGDQAERMRYSTKAGPSGWNEMVMALFEETQP